MGVQKFFARKKRQISISLRVFNKRKEIDRYLPSHEDRLKSSSEDNHASEEDWIAPGLIINPSGEDPTHTARNSNSREKKRCLGWQNSRRLRQLRKVGKRNK